MTVINKINKNYKRSQKGRSMVEMLGVLAIVGVLSVGGVYGYGVAMKKHKANELLHQASMLATTISAQIQSKGELPQSIENFGDAKYGTFKKPEKANDEQFTMQIENMDSAVCEQMEKMASGMVRQAVCNGTTLTLTYNNNLSSDKVAADYNNDEAGCESSGRKYCLGSNSCIASDKECVCSGTVPACKKCDTETGLFITDDEKEGKDCTTSDNKEGTCNTGECVETPTCLGEGQECSDNEGLCLGYYCNISGSSNNEETPCFNKTSGVVRSLGEVIEVLPEYGVFASADAMGWDSAQNYCSALKKAIDEELDAYKDYDLSEGKLLEVFCEDDGSCSLSWSFPPENSHGFWVGRETFQYDWENNQIIQFGNYCEAFYFYNDENLVLLPGPREVSFNALCE